MRGAQFPFYISGKSAALKKEIVRTARLSIDDHHHNHRLFLMMRKAFDTFHGRTEREAATT
jgi:hypothetical protein